MRPFVALIVRDLYEQRLLLLISALAGGVPLLLPHVPRFGSLLPHELRTGVVVAQLALFGVAFLLMLGSTMVGRDLAERRLGFYLVRPLGAWTLWLAKLSAAWLLLVLCLVAIALPTAMVDGHRWLDDVASDVEGSKAAPPVLGTGGAEYFFSYAWDNLPEKLSLPAALALGALWLAIALAAVHGLSTMLRSRSWVLVVDLAAGALTLLALVQAWWLLFEHQALAPMAWWMRWIAPVLLVLLVVAGGRQLSQGRGDLALGHRAFSATLWPGLLALALGTVAWAHWVVYPEVDDLVGPQVVEIAPAGPWLAVGGPTRGRAGAVSAFLVDSENGTSRWLGGLDVTFQWLVFSADGERVIWPRCQGMRPLECTLWQLERDDAGPRDTGIALQSFSALLALSDDGRRLVLAQNGQAELYDLARGRLLTSVRIPTRDLRSIQLVSPTGGNERLRIVSGGEIDGDKASFRIVLREVDLDTLDTTHIATLPNLVVRSRICRRPAADHLLLETLAPARWLLLDGTAGTTLHTLDPPLPDQSRCLADGRVVLARSDTDQPTELMLLAADGQPIGQDPLPIPGPILLGSEIEPGILLAASLGESASGTTRLWRLPLDGSEPEPLLDGMTPLLTSSRHRSAGEVAVGSPASHLLQSKDGSIWRLDPETHQTHRVVGPFPDWLKDPRHTRFPRAGSGRL